MTSLLQRDGSLVLLAKFLRTFAYGLLTVYVPVYLRGTGFTTLRIGLLLSVTVLGGLASTILVILLADRHGRRRGLSLLGLATAASGVMLAASSEFWNIALGLFIGSLSLTGGEIGPFLSIEQSIVPQISSEHDRNRAFSLYNFIGYGGLSLGSLASAISGLPVFPLLAIIGVALAVIYQLLGLRVEAVPSTIRSQLRIPKSSRPVVLKLSALFGMDAFGGGFVLQSVISLWFLLRFQVDLSSLGPIIAAGQIVTAFSILVAGRVADRVGLLNTMVFTHIASNVLLASTAFAPDLRTAIGFYLARQSLSQMDVPTRQAYTMAVVPEEARTPTAGVTTLSRNIAQSISPTFAGYLQAIPGFVGAPFLIAGGIKIAYDILLYRNFRHFTTPSYLSGSEDGLRGQEGENRAGRSQYVHDGDG